MQSREEVVVSLVPLAAWRKPFEYASGPSHGIWEQHNSWILWNRVRKRQERRNAPSLFASCIVSSQICSSDVSVWLRPSYGVKRLTLCSVHGRYAGSHCLMKCMSCRSRLGAGVAKVRGSCERIPRITAEPQRIRGRRLLPVARTRYAVLPTAERPLSCGMWLSEIYCRNAPIQSARCLIRDQKHVLKASMEHA